jgi:hypothetical protein
LKRVRVTIFTVEKQSALHTLSVCVCVCVCVCSLSYPACNAHCHQCLSGSNYIFSTSFHKRKDFWKYLFNIKCVIWFSLQILSEKFKRNLGKYYYKCTYIGVHVKCLLFLSYFKEIWIFWTECRKIFRYHIAWKSVSWEPCCSMRTDGRTEVTKLTVAVSQLCKRA